MLGASVCQRETRRNLLPNAVNVSRDTSGSSASGDSATARAGPSSEGRNRLFLAWRPVHPDSTRAVAKDQGQVTNGQLVMAIGIAPGTRGTAAIQSRTKT